LQLGSRIKRKATFRSTVYGIRLARSNAIEQLTTFICDLRYIGHILATLSQMLYMRQSLAKGGDADWIGGFGNDHLQHESELVGSSPPRRMQCQLQSHWSYPFDHLRIYRVAPHRSSLFPTRRIHRHSLKLRFLTILRESQLADHHASHTNNTRKRSVDHDRCLRPRLIL
jgi:hypothetical protein